MMELGSVNRLFFEKKLEFLGIPKFFYGKSCFMKLEKLRSVSFPQILGVRHPRVSRHSKMREREKKKGGDRS